MFQHKNCTRNKRMGCVQSVTTQGGLWFYGKPGMLGVHSEDTKGDSLFGDVCHCANFRRGGQRSCIFYVLADKAG